MMYVLAGLIQLLFYCLPWLGTTDGAVTTASAGDCLCATTTVNGRSEGSLSGSVVLQLTDGDCGKAHGGVTTSDGYHWIELDYSGHRVWVAGTYLNSASASSCSATSTACPPIITRSQWNARPPESISYQSHPAKYAFIHHAESADCHTESACASLVRSFQNYHMDTHGWGDIGYSFLIGGDGSVFEGRGWDHIGAHTLNYNSVGFGFCFIGNFMSHAPTDIQISRAKQLITCGVSKGKLSSSYTLRGHRDMGSTDCPGDVLYGLIKSWPHY